MIILVGLLIFWCEFWDFSVLVTANLVLRAQESVAIKHKASIVHCFWFWVFHNLLFRIR